jgi:hypothetical protein
VTATGSGRAADEGGVRLLLDFASKVVAPAGVLTAVLYYFGFMREQALLAHFGIDLGSVGFSTTDYLLRSAGTLFVPLVVMLLAAVGAAFAHHALAYAVGRVVPGRRWTVWAALAAVAVVGLEVGAVGLFHRADPALGSLTAPVALGAGAVLLQYAVDNVGSGPVPGGLSSALTATRVLRGVATAALVLISLFWVTADLAQRRGGAAAEALEESLPLQSQAVVYSEQRLQITGPGVQVETLDAAEALYRFRYNGLRTLLHSGGSWFLVPVGWTSENGATVILLADDAPGIRVDLAPSP